MNENEDDVLLYLVYGEKIWLLNWFLAENYTDFKTGNTAIEIKHLNKGLLKMLYLYLMVTYVRGVCEHVLMFSFI